MLAKIFVVLYSIFFLTLIIWTISSDIHFEKTKKDIEKIDSLIKMIIFSNVNKNEK